MLGTCGSLHSEFRVGEEALIFEITDEQGAMISCASKLFENVQETLQIKRARLVSTNRVVVTRSQRETLCLKTGAQLVDMETASIAEECMKAQLPFVVVRTVLDDLQTEILDFNLFIDEQGQLKKAELTAHFKDNPVLHQRFQQGREKAAAALFQVTPLVVESIFASLKIDLSLK